MPKKLKRKIEFETAFNLYIMDEEIGQGGSGRVFGGFSSDGKAVAIKVLTSDRATTDKRKRFKNEIDFLSKVRHPHIVGATDHGIASHKSIQGPFYVMRRFDGNMREYLESISDLNMKLEMFCKVLDGVEAVHLQGSFHRDLKPENVLVDFKTNTPAVADFGIASFNEDLIVTLVETKPAQRLANFQYAAPEQRQKGASVNATADVYALGLMLNEVFTGQVPHGTDYERIETVSSDLAYLDSVVAQMIRQNPENRYATIADVKSSIEMHHNKFITHQRLSAINETVIPEGEVDDPLAHDPPKLVNFDWEAGRLTLYLDREVNHDWVAGLNNMGSHSNVMGFPPASFVFRGKEASPSAAVQPSDVQAIVNQFKPWLPAATRAMKQRLELRLRQEKDRRDRELLKQKQSEEARLRVLSEVKI